MLLEYVLFLLLGILLGVCTGLLPGLHVNTISIMLLSVFPAMGIDPLQFAILLTSMATVHTFLDFIPSIFLGAPEESTVMSLLPTHKLLLQGKGIEAVRITAIASLYGVLFSLGLLAFAFFFIPFVYGTLRAGIVVVLVIAIVFLILRERKINKILWATFVFFISGYLGWVSLNSISALSTQEIFFPLFSGLFGLSTLLMGIQAGSKFYPQEKSPEIKISKQGLRKFSFLGAFGGLLVGLLPAISPSQIGIAFQEIISLKERAKEKLEDLRAREFITIVASLNTADAMFSIFALYLIGNPRSGVSVVIGNLFEKIDFSLFMVLAICMLISGVIAYFIHLYIGKKFADFAGKIDFQKMCIAAFVFVVFLIFILTGFLGLFIASVSLVVGLIPVYTGVSRTHTMGVLLLPAILFFLGIG